MYPGRGPFSYLPPSLRSGWRFKGWCWWTPQWPYQPDPRTELEWLKAEREYLKERLRAIEERIRELEEGGE